MKRSLKILFVNGMHPTPDNLMSGIFITRRLKELDSWGVKFRSISPILKYSREIRFAKKILGKKVINYPKQIINEGIRFDFVSGPINLFEFIQIKTLRLSVMEEIMSSNILDAIDGERFDLVHGHWIYPHGAVAIRLGKTLGIPSIVTAHGSDIHSIPFRYKNFRLPTVGVLKESDKTIFVSSALREKAIQLGFNGNNSVVIPNGIDTDLFKPMDKEKIKKELKIEHKCIGFVGNLIPIKRVDRLAKIFSEITRLTPGIVFLIVGDGNLHGQLVEECKLFGLDVRFTGRVTPKRVPYFMNAMDVMLLPSRNEGWPCVVLEAQACGVPVVGSSKGGIPEAIGNGGVVVPEGECFEELFAKATNNVLNNNMDKSKLVNRAIQFSWSNIIRQEISVYQDLLEGKK